jgi:hypothetical protein
MLREQPTRLVRHPAVAGTHRTARSGCKCGVARHGFAGAQLILLDERSPPLIGGDFVFVDQLFD